MLLVLTANRGLCGGYNGSVLRLAYARLEELRDDVPEVRLEVSGKRGISAFRFRGIQMDERVHALRGQARVRARSNCWPTATWRRYEAGQLDRLDVAYTKFESLSRQHAVVETLLPLAGLDGADEDDGAGRARRSTSSCRRPRAFWTRSCRPASR